MTVDRYLGTKKLNKLRDILLVDLEEVEYYEPDAIIWEDVDKEEVAKSVLLLERTMTRAEVIKILKEIEYPVNGDNKEERDFAINMAIKALERENVLEDIKAEIQEHTQKYTLAIESGGMGHVDWSDYLIKADDIIKLIDKHISGK